MTLNAVNPQTFFNFSLFGETIFLGIMQTIKNGQPCCNSNKNPSSKGLKNSKRLEIGRASMPLQRIRNWLKLGATIL